MNLPRSIYLILTAMKERVHYSLLSAFAIVLVAGASGCSTSTTDETAVQPSHNEIKVQPLRVENLVAGTYIQRLPADLVEADMHPATIIIHEGGSTGRYTFKTPPGIGSSQQHGTYSLEGNRYAFLEDDSLTHKPDYFTAQSGKLVAEKDVECPYVLQSEIPNPRLGTIKVR